jgi:hypothetical protein
VLPLALIVSAGLLAPTAALAASEGLSGYGTTTTTKTTPPPSTTPTTTPTTPSKSGTSPSKEEGTATTTTPTTSSSGVAANTETSTTSTTPSKASTLPFTGFDLRWSLAVGLALIAAGCSLMVMQRRHRRGTGR